MEKLSSTLKHLLTEANISEAELARRTGIAQPMVNRLATGKNKNPKLETLKPIAKYFSVTFSQLLGEEELPPSDARNTQFSTTTNNNQIFQVSLLTWDDIQQDSYNSEKMVATTAKVSEQAFAVVVDSDNLEPRLSKNTLLTIEPNTNYNNNDFILIKDLLTNNISLKQVKVEGNAPQLLSLESDKSTISFNQNQHKVLGVLIQTKHNYK